jgi:hypothetical protein
MFTLVGAPEAPELKPLRDEVDALVGLDPGVLDDAGLTAFVVAARRERDRLDAVIARAAAVFDARGAWKADGSRSAVAHLARRRGEPDDRCRADLRLARALASMPRVAAALASGSITRAHAERLARAGGGPRAAAFADGGEELLVGWAGTLDAHGFERAVAYWVQLADDDAAEADARARDDARALSLVQSPDGWWLDGRMNRTAGTEVAEALRRISDELFAADWQRARQRLARAPAATELERTPAQRRHHALVVMARRALAAPPGTRPPRPLLTIHLGSDQAMLGRLCELSDGTVLTPGEVLPHLTVGDLERALFEPPDRVRVSERTRLFRGAERRAVEIRDRYYTFDGCHTPAERCDIDHTVPDSEGGPTSQRNGSLRCPPHHPGRRRDQPWHHPPQPDPPDPPDPHPPEPLDSS